MRTTAGVYLRSAVQRFGRHVRKKVQRRACPAPNSLKRERVNVMADEQNQAPATPPSTRPSGPGGGGQGGHGGHGSHGGGGGRREGGPGGGAGGARREGGGPGG